MKVRSTTFYPTWGMAPLSSSRVEPLHLIGACAPLVEELGPTQEPHLLLGRPHNPLRYVVMLNAMRKPLSKVFRELWPLDFCLQDTWGSSGGSNSSQLWASTPTSSVLWGSSPMDSSGDQHRATPSAFLPGDLLGGESMWGESVPHRPSLFL